MRGANLRESFVASGRQNLGRFDARRVAKEHEELMYSVMMMHER